MLQLHIVSQEKELVRAEASQVTVMSEEGELTILPNHAPLFSKLKEGLLRYTTLDGEHSVVLSPGFMTVDPDSRMTIMVDSAILARDVSEEKAQAAIEAAQKTLETSEDRRELLLAEASLKLAMLEAKVARKSKKAGI